MLKDLVIFDLDGTLADVQHRRHFVEGKNKNFNAFYKACIDDKPNLPVIRAAQALHASGHTIWIFSGRSDLVIKETKIWLANHQIPYSKLLMRKNGDYTPDDVLKWNWIKPDWKDRVLCIYDDRKKVVDMWRAKGITCFQVAEGDF